MLDIGMGDGSGVAVHAVRVGAAGETECRSSGYRYNYWFEETGWAADL